MHGRSARTAETVQTYSRFVNRNRKPLSNHFRNVPFFGFGSGSFWGFVALSAAAKPCGAEGGAVRAKRGRTTQRTRASPPLRCLLHPPGVVTAPPRMICDGLLAAAGEGGVAPVLEVVGHPVEVQRGLATQLPPRTRQLAGSAWLPRSDLHGDTLPECHQSF